MPPMDFQQSSSTPSHSHSFLFYSFGCSFLSLRRDTPASASSSAATAAAAMSMHGVDPKVEEFHVHVAAQLADLMRASGGGGEEFLSIAWVRCLLEAFLLCHEEFRVLVAEARRRGAPSAARNRNRSFGRARASPSCTASLASSSSTTHFRSLSWSVSRNWSVARQLQAIGSGLQAALPQASGLAAPAYAMGSLLHLAAWALVAAVPFPDRGGALQLANHLPAAPPRAAFPWAPPLLALQERLAEEGRRKDRRNSCGLLREILALEKSVQRLAEAIDDAAPTSAPLTGEREAEVREAAAELATVCAALKDGLDPLERQLREVFHSIVRSRMEGLDLPMLNAG